MKVVRRAKFPKLGVFLHPEVLKQLEKRCKDLGERSMTRFTEKLIHRELGIEPNGKPKP